MSNLVQPPIPKIVTRVWAYFEVEVISIVLNTSATIAAKIFDEHMSFVESIIMVMQGQDYQNWTEDSYLISWTNQQLHNLV